MSETIVTGKKYRILTDVAQKVWQRVSFWTKSTDVEFNDAKTAETKVGAIDGITDSLSSNSSRIAASAKAVNQLNGDLSNKTTTGSDVAFAGVHLGGSSIAYVYSENDNVNFRFKDNSGSENWTNIKDIINSLNDIRTSFQAGCNAIVNQLIYRGVTPSSNSITDICKAIDQLALASQATLTDISNQFSSPVYVGSPAQAHRVTSNADLTGYKYIILSFGYQNVGMSLNGGIYITNCTQVNYSASGDLGVAVLQNVKYGATIDFQHTGTGAGNRIAWGIK